MRLFLLFCICLFPALVFAQTTVSGQVLDAKSGDAIAGATILQTGTINGVASDVGGNFTLTVPATSDSVALTFSSIGYATQRQTVASGSHTTIKLVFNNKAIECLLTASPCVEVGLASGVQHTPFGGSLKLYGYRLVRLPINATVNYQTNFRRNHVFTTLIELPPLWQHHFSVTEAFSYEQVLVPANVRFTSYKMLVSVGSFRTFPFLPYLTYLLGGGYAQHQPLAEPEAGSTAGFGYSFGLQTHYYFQPFRLAGAVQATRWPDYWQWQARLAHPFGRDFQAGVVFNQLRSYAELSVLLTRTFY